jgi:hypothetical protein
MTKIKKFTTLQLFSLADGRMSTNMDDIYDMLNHIYNEDFMTHQLPVVFGYLKQENPQWFKDLKEEIKVVKDEYGNDFQTLIDVIKMNNKEHDIPQFADAEKAGLLDYFADNSLLGGKSTDEKRDSKIDRILKN